MSAQKTFEVIEESQEALLIGTLDSFSKTLSLELTRRGVLPTHLLISGSTEKTTGSTITPGKILQKLASGFSPDLVLWVEDHHLTQWLSVAENKALIKKLEASLGTARKISLVWEGRGEVDVDRRLFLDEILGENPPKKGLLIHMYEEALAGKIIVPGDGLDTFFPLDKKDAVEAVLHAAFAPLGENSIRISGEEGISLLNLAYTVRSHLPQKTSIMFGEPVAVPPGEPLPKISAWKPKKPLDVVLKETLIWLDKHKDTLSEPHTPPAPLESEEEVKTKQETLPPTAPLNPAPRRDSLEFVPIKKARSFSFPKLPAFRFKFRTRNSDKSTRSRGKKVVLTLALVFGFYLSSLVLASLALSASLRQITRFADGGGRVGVRSGQVARTSAIYLEANITFISSLPGLRSLQTLREVRTLAHSVTLLTESTEDLANLTGAGSAVFRYVLEGENLDVEKSIQQLKTSSDSLYQKLSLLEGELPEDPPSILPEKYLEKYTSSRERLRVARHHALSLKGVSSALGEIIGVGETRKYAILFQNNMELRPTGGFIGSLAIASLENGQLFDFQIYDVYQADGQLKGHVEPPPEIKEHLGEANWYLRDSNWNPSFPTSARTAEWFIEKTLNQKLNGTIAINLFTIKDILKEVGPLELSDYDETITSENLFERAEYHAEIDFFPGSTQKKEFIASLASSLLTKLKATEPKDLPPLLYSVYSSLNAKDTLVSLTDANHDAIFDQLGWNGSIRDLPCPDLGQTAPCVNDYIFLVDSNLGINKANYFLQRQLELGVTIDKDLSVASKLKVTYTNTASSGSWPAGNYKNYSRIYLPASTNIKSIKVGGRPLTSTEISLNEEEGKTVVGFLVVVPIEKTVAVELEYALSSALSENEPLYSLYWQKQPGTDEDPLRITVTYPLFLNPQIISPRGEASDHKSVFSLLNSQDRRVTLKF